MKVTKTQLKKMIKEEYDRMKEQEYPESGSQEEAQYEVMRQMGLFLGKLLNEGHKELADEFDRILVMAQEAGMDGGKGW